MLIAPQRIVSLWEMIEILNKGNLVASVSAIGSLCKYLQMAHRECIEAKRPGIVIDQAQADVMIQGTIFLGEVSRDLGMVSASAASADVREVIARIPGTKAKGYELDLFQIGQLAGSLEYQIRAFRDEIDARALFVMNPIHVSFYAPTTPLFGEAVDDAFPAAAQEIADAGKCRAAGLWTASVMHLMRAIEEPLNSLAQRFGVDTGQNWNTALTQIEAELRARNKSQHGENEEQWASEASAHLRAVKNAWRNYAQHGRARYNEEEAVSIWNNVQSLMQTLAKKLG